MAQKCNDFDVCNRLERFEELGSVDLLRFADRYFEEIADRYFEEIRKACKIPLTEVIGLWPEGVSEHKYSR